jgi:hypothetical protein
METLVHYYNNNNMFKLGVLVGFGLGIMISSLVFIPTTAYLLKLK